MLAITLISCSKVAVDSSSLCSIKIQYHTSSDCDDSSKIAIYTSFSFDAQGQINNIEEALIGAGTGECILLSLTSFKDEESNQNLGDVFLVNDTNKSWLIMDCSNP